MGCWGVSEPLNYRQGDFTGTLSVLCWAPAIVIDPFDLSTDGLWVILVCTGDYYCARCPVSDPWSSLALSEGVTAPAPPWTHHHIHSALSLHFLPWSPRCCSLLTTSLGSERLWWNLQIGLLSLATLVLCETFLSDWFPPVQSTAWPPPHCSMVARCSILLLSMEVTWPPRSHRREIWIWPAPAAAEYDSILCDFRLQRSGPRL